MIPNICFIRGFFGIYSAKLVLTLQTENEGTPSDLAGPIAQLVRATDS